MTKTTMPLNRLSMRVSLIVIIVAMGMLGIFLVVASGGVFRDFAVESQRAALSEQLKIRTNDLRKELEAEAQQLALLAQNEPGFVTAVERKNAVAIEKHLDKLLAQPGSVSARVRLIKLQVFEPNLNLLASSAPVPQDADLSQPSCQSLRAVVARRNGAERHKPAAGICVADKKIYHLVIHALSDASHGYLSIVTDMLFNLAASDNTLGMPIKLSLADGAVLYKSANWPGTEEMGTKLMAEYPLSGYASSKVALHIAVLQDMRAFEERLAQTEYMTLLVAALAAALTVLMALLAMQKTAIEPLRTLTEQLRKLRLDKAHFGQRVTVAGNSEVVELGAGFNEMTVRLKELYESLESLAFTDPLTKLPNRTLFHENLQQTIVDAKRDYKPFALFIMDLDRFKDINDTLGHHIGDKVLQQVAVRLRGKLREIDIVARMGGDEFAVMLPAVNEKHADMAARMLLQALRTPIQIEEQSLDIGASIGIVLYPDHGVDANILIQRADVAMYSAKQSNTGYAFYNSKLDQHHPSRLVLMGELRQAVEQEQFVLYFQPKVNLKNFKVTGVEALVRWKHPDHDLRLPDTFIPLLEHTGLIRSLTPWVLNESLKQGQLLQSQELPIAISMNLSVRDLQDPYLADAFAEQLAALQISPRWLELEITESAVMTDPVRALEVLSRLSAMGLKLAIDDFGTGYSSLSYLKKLPVDTIKIDKSFVIGMARDENDAAIVRTSIDLAHNLGLEVVAEGVETEETLDRLTELGCDTVQGHYISRPLSAQDLGVWLNQSTWNLTHNRRNIRLQN